MKVAELIESRRGNWRQLDQMCDRMERLGKRRMTALEMARFAALYRACCADLALSESYQLPEATVRYLHQLVGRAHNQLYRSRMFQVQAWFRELLVHVPRRLFHDGFFRLAMALFWGGFALSWFLASPYSPITGYAKTVAGEEMLVVLDDMYSRPVNERADVGMMTGFYIQHNTGIGLRCFALGLLFGVGGLLETVFNAVFLGAIFGHMAYGPHADNFLTFVTAHGPFELTGIAMSAGAGMKLGFSIVDTRGLTRSASLRRAGREAMPIMGAAMVLFALAACIEGFISPSPLPYAVKAAIAIGSTILLFIYIVVLGFRRPLETATTDGTQ